MTFPVALHLLDGLDVVQYPVAVRMSRLAGPQLVPASHVDPRPESTEVGKLLYDPRDVMSVHAD